MRLLAAWELERQSEPGFDRTIRNNRSRILTDRTDEEQSESNSDRTPLTEQLRPNNSPRAIWNNWDCYIHAPDVFIDWVELYSNESISFRTMKSSANSPLPNGDILFLPLFLLSLISFQGCRSDPTSPGADTAAFSPRVGSTYTFEEFDVDKSGTKIAGTEKPSTITVGGTGLSFFGRTGVASLGSGVPSDSMWIVQESNGDLSMLVPGQTGTHSGSEYVQSPTLWITYPFGSKTGKRVVVDFDTTATLNGVLVSFSVRHTVEYSGSEEVQVGSETLTAQKVTEVIHRVDSDKTGSYGATYTSTFWYVPTIGFFVRIDGMRVDESGNDDRWRAVLKSYVLQ